MADCLDKRAISRAVRRLADAIEPSLSAGTIMDSGGTLVSTDLGGQASFWLKPKSEIDRIILHFLRSHIANSERAYPGSGDTAVRVCIAASRHWLSQEEMGRSPADLHAAVDLAIDQASKARITARRLTIEDAMRMVEVVPNPARDQLVSLFPSLPLGTSISVRRGRGDRTTVETRSGCAIKVDPVSSHLTKKIRDPRIVLFDGTIDRVSQLHRVLTDSAERGQSYLICCRQTSQEVEETIRVNLARGTVSVILARSRLDDKTVGAIDDIAAYTGASVITAQSGESISTVFDRLTGTRGEIWLEGDSVRLGFDASDSLAPHVDRLRRDAATNNQDVADFLGSRIMGLSSSKLEVLVGEGDVRSSPRLFERIDVEMRSLMACFSRGISPAVSPDFDSMGEMGDVVRGSSVWGLPVPGADASAIISGLRFARDLCTIGFAVLQQPALASPRLQ